MSEVPNLPPVDKWDMTGYPIKDHITGKPLSNVYRLYRLDKDGNMMKEYDNVKSYGIIRGTEKESRHWREDENGEIGYRYGPRPESLRVTEDKMGGKPTTVLMGLWAYPDPSKPGLWVRVDKNKSPSGMPLYWRDVTKEYYAEWRPEAYPKTGKNAVVDPYENDEVPTTRVMDLEKRLAEAQKLIPETNKLVQG